MERAAWTDERLNDLVQRMEAGFERVDSDMRVLRTDIRDVRADVHVEINGLRVEMGQRFDFLQATIVRFGGGMLVCLLGAIVAFSLGGS